MQVIVFEGTLKQLPRYLHHGNRCFNELDYFIAWKLRDDDIFRKLFSDCRNPDDSLKPGYFFKIVDYYCDFYDIPRFKSKATTVSVNKKALELYSDYNLLKIVKDSGKKSVYECRWFDFNSCRWMYGDTLTFHQCYLTNTVKKICPHIIAIKNRELIEQQKEDERNNPDAEKSAFRKTQKVASVESCLPSVKSAEFVNMFPHVESFNTNDEWIPFDDKVLNIHTKEITLNLGQAKNTYKPYQNLSEHLQTITDDDPDIQMFKSFFSNWANCEIQGRTLLLYLILCVCKQAHTTRKAPVLIGRTQIGKSFYMDLIGLLINQHKHEINLASPREKPSDVFSSDNHGSAARVNFTFVGIDELREDSPIDIGALFEWLKFAIQSDRRQINVNPKGKARFFAYEKFATVITVEEKLVIPTDPGLDGRLVYFRFKETVKDVENHRRLLNNEDGILDKILAWCLLQNVEAVKAEFLQLTEHQIFTDALKAKKYDADLMFRFVNECIEVTNDPKDKLTYRELFDHQNAWHSDESGDHKPIYNKMKTFEMDFKSMLQNTRLLKVPLDSAFFDREEVDKSKHRYGHRGIKLIENL